MGEKGARLYLKTGGKYAAIEKRSKFMMLGLRMVAIL